MPPRGTEEEEEVDAATPKTLPLHPQPVSPMPIRPGGVEMGVSDPNFVEVKEFGHIFRQNLSN